MEILDYESSPLKIGHHKREGSSSNHPFVMGDLLLVSGRVGPQIPGWLRFQVCFVAFTDKVIQYVNCFNPLIGGHVYNL